jgi:hypothetical protein
LRSVFALQHVARAILEIGRNESPMQGYSEIHTSTVVINLANLFGHLVRIDLILGFEASIHIPMEDCGGAYGKILVDFKFILQRECKTEDSQTREVYFCIWWIGRDYYVHSFLVKTVIAGHSVVLPIETHTQS